MPEFQFDSVSDFFAMGGDAFFVWVSYLVFVLFVAWCVLVPRWQRKKVVHLIRARRQREETMQGNSEGVKDA